jgi:hypothetical protein
LIQGTCLDVNPTAQRPRARGGTLPRVVIGHMAELVVGAVEAARSSLAPAFAPGFAGAGDEIVTDAGDAVTLANSGEYVGSRARLTELTESPV